MLYTYVTIFLILYISKFIRTNMPLFKFCINKNSPISPTQCTIYADPPWHSKGENDKNTAMLDIADLGV